jgi:hypothetical protein
MNKTHLTQVWQWLSIACVLFLVTGILSLQGGSEYLGRLFGDKGGSAADKAAISVADSKVAIGYFGAIIGGGLFLLASGALALHARRHGEHWHARVPVVWLEGLDTGAWEAKLFQVVILVIFVALPVAGIIRCIAEAESGDICELDVKHFYKGSETTLLWPPVAQEGHQIRLRRAGAGEEPCTTGVELFPRTLTPLLFYGLPLAAGGMAALALVLVFRREKPGAPDDAAGDGGDSG